MKRDTFYTLGRSLADMLSLKEIKVTVAVGFFETDIFAWNTRF